MTPAPEAASGMAAETEPGDLPRWKILYSQMRTLPPRGLLRYEDMGDALGLDFLDPKGKQAILNAARRAADELRVKEQKVLRIVRGHGYERAEPEQVIEMARRHQARAVAEVVAGRDKVEAIDRTTVDVTTARLIEATAMGFARQAFIMRQLDVRQERLETAMAAVTVTAQAAIARADEAASKADGTQAAIDELRQQLNELESRQRDDALHTLPVRRR